MTLSLLHNPGFRRWFFLFFFLLSCFCLPSSAFAACASPAGNEADMIYNKTSHVMQFCDGAVWRAMGKVPGLSVSNSNTVFITSTTYLGNIGSVAAANTICATRATAAGLTGIYKAWIATTAGVDDPATTFTHSAVPYKEVNGTTIANNWAGLTSGTLLAGISLDENGTSVGSVNVWTDVATTGAEAVSANCTAWTSNLGTISHTGALGNTNDATSNWTDSGALGFCNTSNHLYCFQQDGGAGCASPAGNEGDMMYNGTSHVMQYCDGTLWRAMGKVPGTGGGGSSNIYKETDTAGTSNLFSCNGVTASAIAGRFDGQMIRGGTAGTTHAVTITKAANQIAYSFLSPANDPNLTSWQSGNWVVRLDVTTANANLNWEDTCIFRVDSTGTTNLAAVGSLTGQTISLGSAGVQTMTVSGSTQAASASDRIYIETVFIETSGLVNQSATATFDQNVNTPLLGGSSNTVFITSALVTGVTASDASCQNVATAAGLAGTYKAWLAVTTGTNDPATTFTHPAVPYKEVDGTTIASNWAGLTSGTLTNAITLDETGTTVSGQKIFTNVATNGTAIFSGSSTTQNCAGWTTGIFADTAYYGLTSSATSTWTNAVATTPCSVASGARLYCFQQNGGAGCLGPAGNEGDYMYNGTSHVYQYCDGAVWRSMKQ